MANEDIITGLRNAVEHGDSLQDAIQIMINSGYNPTEVYEASKYIWGGVLPMQETKPEDHLVTPNKKPMFSGISFLRKPAVPPAKQTPLPSQQTPYSQQQISSQNSYSSKQIHSNQAQPPQQSSKFQPLPSRASPLTQELKKIKPKGQSHAKEIILLLVLLILIGLLVATIVFRDKILGWFS